MFPIEKPTANSEPEESFFSVKGPSKKNIIFISSIPDILNYPCPYCVRFFAKHAKSRVNEQNSDIFNTPNLIFSILMVSC